MVGAERAAWVQPNHLVLDFARDDTAMAWVVEVALRNEEGVGESAKVTAEILRAHLPAIDTPANEEGQGQIREANARKRERALTWRPN